MTGAVSGHASRLLQELGWRGLIAAVTPHLDTAAAAGPPTSVVGYVGFDPTADSLHAGHLLPVMLLRHLQRAGHGAVALVGGGTAMIGDPSGKATERQLLSSEIVEGNAAAVRAQLGSLLAGGDGPPIRVVDNATWIDAYHVTSFLRDIGKHFPVAGMLQKDSVRTRLAAGLSFTEFAYMLLQAADFLELHRAAGVTVQIGGSDQWGNITAGIELLRREAGVTGHGLTTPLLTDSSGAKFGKTERGAVWLDPSRTSPYAFYQFWLNQPDDAVAAHLRYFTMLDATEIDAALAPAAGDPRRAQRLVARDVTTWVHGPGALAAAEEVCAILFGPGVLASVSVEGLAMLRQEIPCAEVPSEAVISPDRQGRYDVIALFVASGLATSRGDAKRLLEQGGACVDKRRLRPEEQSIALPDLVRTDGHLLLSRGKRDYGLVRLT